MGESTTQPLLTPETGHAGVVRTLPTTQTVKVAQREWRRSWWAPLGHCSASDAVALLLTLKLPLVAHAWNEARIGARPFFKTVLLWALGLLVMGMLANLQVAGFMATCPAEWHTEGPSFPLSADLPVYLHTSEDGLRVLSDNAHPTRATFDEWEIEAHGPDMMESAMMDGPGGGPFHHHPPPPNYFPLPEELRCYGPAISTGATVAMFALICLGLLHLARRRQALRTQFGIDGSLAGDCAVYAFCAPCALAQETRTLMHNHVHEGLWHGPLPQAAVQYHAAPAPVAAMV